MSFKTQRLVNKFPTWAKIRRDPSSFGARMFSVFADYFDYQSMESRKVSKEFHLLKMALGKPWIWRLTLDEDDQMPVDSSAGGKLTYTYPTAVSGEHAIAGTQSLTRVESVEDLLWSVPDGVSTGTATSYTNSLIWDSDAPTTYNDLAYTERLEVIVSGSTDYFKKSRLKNRQASGWHYVIITGEDVNGIEITEHMNIRDDGRYWTRNIWSRITDVSTDGFDGRTQVYIHTPVTTEARMLIDPYHLISTDATEGPLKLQLSNDVVTYVTQRILSGQDYRTGDSGGVVDNDEIVWDQYLADEGGTVLTGLVDIAINPDTGRLYALAGTGVVYVYDHGLTVFSPPTDEDLITNRVDIEIHPLKNWATFNETLAMYTFFRKPRSNIVSVEIKRRSPSGTVEYLQADKSTWAVGAYQFPSSALSTKIQRPEETWQDIKFTSVFNEYGQWEFYCTTVSQAGTHVDYTGVMVDKLTALAALTTGVTSPTGLFFSENGQLVVMNATDFNHFDTYSHTYFANGATQEVYMREEYTSVEVTF